LVSFPHCRHNLVECSVFHEWFKCTNGGGKHLKDYTLKTSIDYSFSNGNLMSINIGTNTIINNTKYTLTVEKVEYDVSLLFNKLKSGCNNN